MQDYHKLRVWERAHKFAVEIRRAANDFPPGFSEIRTQLVRAAESIPTNLVEGCGAATPKEFARFVDISIKSSSEVEYELELAHDHHLIDDETFAKWLKEIVEIRKMLYGLRKRLLAAADVARRRRRAEGRRRRGAAD
jgi:four helix bundle protein